ncbi:hypothetical protein AB0I34_28555 [Kribbella sp. NPDC050281]|uniref:hypothetical protein n=1 Tax=Kribbella sp. NPDC050281 TaxID=3155515 RepID=UPI0033D9EAFA
MTMHDDRRMNEPTEDDRLIGTTDDDRLLNAKPVDDRTDDLTDDRRVDGTTDDRLMDDTTDDRLMDDTTDDRLMGGDERTSATREQAVDAPAADEPLLASDLMVDYRSRWEVIQQGFVDDPRNAVSEADTLVDDVLKRLSESFERQHQGLEKQWSDGEPSTEDLRSALQKYRAFFQRLLTL